ncbi:MAG: plasmid recombination protein [Clostridia bacterium]|nr:plasmid recombination protein [Clostridia bacterium]
MSYAIVRNEKLTRVQAQGICVHNNRKSKNHSNKEIDVERTHLNYYLKKNKLSYIKEFDRIKKENNLQGQIRSNSIIMCEMIFTSDKEFFNKIGIEETKRYFEESYKFISKYKNLGEENIISAVVHLDEGTPHMHLIYIPTIHTQDKDGNDIDKICCRDFWEGRDSYRKLQNAYYEYVTQKGFELERGLPKEETNREHYTIQEFKNITNFEKTKETLKNIKLELPEVPELKDIKKVMIGRDEKILNEIIKPKDKLIETLYYDNKQLHEKLEKQVNIIDSAEKFEKERENILLEQYKLKSKCAEMEEELERKSKKLEKEYNAELQKMQDNFSNKEYELKREFNRKYDDLLGENRYLRKIINTFEKTVKKFIKWIVRKFDIAEEDNLIRDFQEETNTFIDPERQIKHEEREKEWDLER